MVLNRFIGEVQSYEEPDYVYTMPHNGRKYIKPDEFISLPHVMEQMDELDELLESGKLPYVEKPSVAPNGSAAGHKGGRPTSSIDEGKGVQAPTDDSPTE